MHTKIKVVMACGLIAASVLVPLTVVGAAEQSVFVGSWEATDANDSSSEKMQIRGGGNGEYIVILQDSRCSGCCPGCAEEDQPPYNGIGVGTLNEDGTILTAVLKVYAMGGPSYPCHGATPTVNFTYIDDNTIEDDAGDFDSTWTRID
jgi:hypothetical protein